MWWNQEQDKLLKPFFYDRMFFFSLIISDLSTTISLSSSKIISMCYLVLNDSLFI